MGEHPLDRLIFRSLDTDTHWGNLNEELHSHAADEFFDILILLLINILAKLQKKALHVAGASTFDSFFKHIFIVLYIIYSYRKLSITNYCNYKIRSISIRNLGISLSSLQGHISILLKFRLSVFRYVEHLMLNFTILLNSWLGKRYVCIIIVCRFSRLPFQNLNCIYKGVISIF